MYQCVALDENTRTVFAISDKRICTGTFKKGKLKSFRHLHDNYFYINPITERVYSIGGSMIDLSENFHMQLLEVKDKKPSEIVDFASNLDRKSNLASQSYNEEKIFGVWDDGRLFMWCGKTNGLSNLVFPVEESIIFISGGLVGTKDRAAEVLFQELKRNNDFAEAMIKSLEYAASIDETISPTYDLLTFTNNKEIVLDEFLMLTSESGQRWSVSGEDNTMKFHNNDEKLVIQLDDDSAVEGSYYTNYPPLILPGQANPKNYLGAKNMPDGSFRYYYANMGPGISVGVSPTDAEGFSTVGRKEIYTNGKIKVANADDSQKTEINKTGITTTGNVDVGATLNVAGALNVTGPIRYNGHQGATVYELVSSQGNQTRKYINGGYIGIGVGNNW
jgi:hypothetical protein